MKKLFFIIAVLGVGYYWYQGQVATVSLGDGIKTSFLPEQTQTRVQPFEHEGYVITPLYNFKLEAKALSKKSYRDNLSEIGPIDIAFGWNQMSDEAILKNIKISQRGRWYYWNTPEFPIPRKQIETSSANMHLIHANEEVKQVIAKVKKGQIIQLQGELVQVHKQGQLVWNSSTTRNDTGGGACEVIYVRSFKIVE